MKKFNTMQELFSDPSRWCKNAYAKDIDGNEVSAYDITACQWCLLGAMNYIYNDLTLKAIRLRIYDYIHNAYCDDRFIAIWNDEEATIDDIQKLCKELNI